ncbi:hypothetical protein F0562_012762 [Nyssa sinensis]|uniref:Uncharacterized protein n=1 Tax=Nyssa sinensis TaxID=561372 RepID=A0A5J4ZVP5_9ASTE|nr:hypothetical protein F0562_012762 [Nyssa sinensis]
MVDCDSVERQLSEKKVIPIYIANVVNALEGEDNVKERHAHVEHVTGNEGENGSDTESGSNSDFEYFADGNKLDDVVSSDESLFEDLFDEFSIGNDGFVIGTGDGNGGSDGMERPTNIIVDDEIDKNDSDTNSLKSPRNPDDELFIKYPKFNEDRDMEKPDLKLGMIFSSVKVFKSCIKGVFYNK